MSSGANGRVVAILGFHKIGAPPAGGWETRFYIPEATFVGYLSYLRETGWQIIDLAAFLRGLEEPDSLLERSALITFDDGYRSILDHGLPQLERFGYPAVMFVPTDFIGGWNRFDAGSSEPEEAICDWQDLRELQRRGVSVQSHGAAHRAFSELGRSRRREEVRRSKRVLEDRLGTPVEVFSFPYGDGGTEPGVVRRELERTGYRAACLYGGGPERLPGADPFRLARLAMGPYTDLRAELSDVGREARKRRRK